MQGFKYESSLMSSDVDAPDMVNLLLGLFNASGYLTIAMTKDNKVEEVVSEPASMDKVSSVIPATSSVKTGPEFYQDMQRARDCREKAREHFRVVVRRGNGFNCSYCCSG